MNRRSRLVAGLLPVALLVACNGRTIARATLAKPGTTTAQFMYDGNPLVFWADYAGEWRGGEARPAISYSVDFVTNGAPSGHVTCDVRESTSPSCEQETTTGDTHVADCEVKLTCEAPTPPIGQTEMRVTVSAGSMDQLTKANLIVRTR